MKRNKFIFSLAALAATPLPGFAKHFDKTNRAGKGFKVEKGEGRYNGHIQLKGVNNNILDVKISGKDTDGDLALFEQTSLTPGRGTPLHVHHSQDEMFTVLEGNYFFKVGDEKFHLNPGECIFLPRKVPHAWTQISETGKMMVLFQPAGKMEVFFLSVAAMTKEPTQVEMAKLFIDNEMQIVGPPLQIE